MGRGCAYKEKSANPHSCCRCLKAGGTTQEMMSSLSPEVTKLRPDGHLKKKTQQRIPALDSADWEKTLLNPEFLRICVCPGHVQLCVCVCVCVCVCMHRHCHALSTLHLYTHTHAASLGTSWQTCLCPTLGTLHMQAPPSTLSPFLCAREAVQVPPNP